MSYIVHHKNAKFSRSLIGKFIPDLSLIVSTSNSISLYTLDLVLLKDKALLDEVIQVEKYRHSSQDGVAIMFRENRMSFVYYDYTINDFSIHGLKYFSGYPSVDPFFRLQDEIGFAKINNVHFAIFTIHTKMQSAIFSFRDVKKDLRNVTDACFLNHYKLPTLCFLYRPHIYKYTKEDDVRVLVVSFDLHTKTAFVQYDYKCMPYSCKVIGLDSVLVVISRNFVSFYKNEYIYMLANSRRYESSGSEQSTISNPGLDTQERKEQSVENTAFSGVEQSCVGNDILKGSTSAANKDSGSPLNMEQKANLENTCSQTYSAVETPPEPKQCSQCIDIDFVASEFIGQARSLLIFSPSKTVLVVPKEDSHKAYGLDVFEVKFNTRASAGCTEGADTIAPCINAISVFENIIFTDAWLFTLEEQIACHLSASQTCRTLSKNVATAKSLERTGTRCILREMGKVPVGYCRMYVANDKICLSNDTTSVIQNASINSATTNFHYFNGLYYRIANDSVDVLNDNLVKISTFGFTNHIRKSHACPEVIVLLEDSLLVVRDLEMKIIKEFPEVRCFAVNEYLIVARGTMIEMISIESMDLEFKFYLDDFCSAAVNKVRAEEMLDAVEQDSVADTDKHHIAEIESVGDRDNLCLIMRSGEDDFFAYRIFKDTLIKISHNKIPEFGPGRSFFRTGRFLYIKAKVPLVVCCAPFSIQECPYAFEYISENLGLQDGKLLEIKFESCCIRDTPFSDNAVSIHRHYQDNKDGAGSLYCSGRCDVYSRSSNTDTEHMFFEKKARKRGQVLEAHKNGVRNYVAVSTKPAMFFKEKIDAQPENSEEDVEVEQIGAETLQFSLELYSSAFQFINEYGLLKDEYVNSMKMLELNDIHSQSGRGEFLVVCTSYVKSEDWQFKGRLLLFDLVEVNPVPLKPWTNRKLKILCIENCKGPVLDCCSLRGNIACCMGTKLMVFEVDRNEGINAIAFHDLQILATRIKTVKNYVCLGDIANGLMFFYFQAKPFKIHLLAGSSKFCCDDLDFIIHNSILSMVGHGGGTYRIYTYTPTNMFFDGTLLIKRCEFKSRDAVVIGFVDSDLVDRLYLRTLKSLKNTCGLTSSNTVASDRLQPHTVRPPIYSSLLYEFLNLGLREQHTICADAMVDRKEAVAALRCALNK